MCFCSYVEVRKVENIILSISAVVWLHFRLVWLEDQDSLLTDTTEQSPSLPLPAPHLLKKLPAFFGKRRLNSFSQESAFCLPLDPHESKSTPFHRIYWGFVLICLGLTSVVFPPGFLTKTLYACSFIPIRATCPAHLIFLLWLAKNKYR